MKEGTTGVRLLPWTGPDGKPCYLVSDGTGPVSRIADTVESMQLDMAGGLLDHAADMLGDRRATPAQLRFLVARMSEALTDVRRIAESRGARLPVAAHAEPHAEPDGPSARLEGPPPRAYGGRMAEQ